MIFWVLACSHNEPKSDRNTIIAPQSCQAMMRKNVLLDPDKPVPWCIEKPVYPIGAWNSKIEGYVIVEYTILENGKVDNIVVLEAEPPGLFEQAAIDALKRSFYVPSGKIYKNIKLKNVFEIPKGIGQ